MNPLDRLLELSFDTEILSLPSQSHIRRKYIREYILTTELVRYLIEDAKYTIHHISKNIMEPRGYFGAGDVIRKICKENGIKIPTISDSATNPMVREKYKNTCLIRYGSINALSKGTSSYKKRNRTVKKKYGVTNVFQLDDVKIKSKNTMVEKYGVLHTVNMPSYERNYGRRSRPHRKIEKFLQTIGVPYESEVGVLFSKFNESLNKHYSPIVDILIESKKIVIEIYGDNWHANPKIYKSTDMIHKWGGLISAEEIRKFDRIRRKHIESCGYDVIELWQSDIERNFEKIKMNLNEILKNNIY